MTAPGDPLFDRAHIEELFRQLGERLRRRGVLADIYVFGGAAMALAYDARRATRGIGAVLRPHGIVPEEAHALAAELFPDEELPPRALLVLADIFDGIERGPSWVTSPRIGRVASDY